MTRDRPVVLPPLSGAAQLTVPRSCEEAIFLPLDGTVPPVRILAPVSQLERLVLNRPRCSGAGWPEAVLRLLDEDGSDEIDFEEVEREEGG